MSAKVTFKRPSLEMEIEVGSLKELAGYITDEGSTLSKVFGSDMSLVVKSLGGSTEAPEIVAVTANVGDERPTFHTAPEAAPTEEKKPRGRPKKQQPDPSTASAPAPVQTPGDAPAIPVAPVPHAPEVDPPAPAPVATAAGYAVTPKADDDGIPLFLKNQTDAPALAPPAPPPPPAPIAPPTGVLAGKVIAKTDEYKTAGKEETILNWLIGTGIVQAGSTYDEAISVIRLLPDAKLGEVAKALSIAA